MKTILDFFLRGYRMITCPEGQRDMILSRLYRSGITALWRGDSILIFSSDCGRVRSVLDGRTFSVSEGRGLPSRLYKAGLRFGVWIGLLLCFLLFFLTGRVVWDVRISGDENLDVQAVSAEISRFGLSAGSLWSALDTESAEKNIMTTSDALSWVNIERRGNVAYIRAVAKAGDERTPVVSHTDIVADRDCVIESVDVGYGQTRVSVGQQVCAGDVLIGGTYSIEGRDEISGSALGHVYGRYAVGGAVFVPNTVLEKEITSESAVRKEISFFGLNFSENYLKNSRKADDTCVIIKEKYLKIFNRYNLPIRIRTETARNYCERSVTLDEKEMIRRANAELNSILSEQYASAEVCSLHTVPSFSPEGFTLTWEAQIVSEVGIYR